MQGHIAALYRHPVKGFTPERLAHADLAVGGPFPCDRLYAVENGPSGFDPAAPGHISKQKFTVLAAIPSVATAHTAYDEASHVLDRHRAQPAGLQRSPGRECRAAGLRRLAHDPVG